MSSFLSNMHDYFFLWIPDSVCVCVYVRDTLKINVFRFIGVCHLRFSYIFRGNIYKKKSRIILKIKLYKHRNVPVHIHVRRTYWREAMNFDTLENDTPSTCTNILLIHEGCHGKFFSSKIRFGVFLTLLGDVTTLKISTKYHKKMS